MRTPLGHDGEVVTYVNRSRAVGRPKKEARDAAVFIARMWRVDCLKESVAQADKWIIEHWADVTPKGEQIGITDPAHVRAAVRRAGATWLKHCDFSFNDGLRVTSDTIQLIDDYQSDWLSQTLLEADFEMDGCAIVAFESVIHGNARGCIWMSGMREARQIKRVKIHEEGRAAALGPGLSYREGITQVAAGVAEFIGLLQMRTLRRFHQGRDRSRFLRKS